LTIGAGYITETYPGVSSSRYAFGNLNKQTIIRSSHRPIANVGGIEMPIAFLPDLPNTIAPPQTGTYVMKSIDGVVQWVAE
jgi:hypothetical protein